MTLQQIKSRYDESVLFECEAASIREAVETACKARANLEGANLEGANLEGANLYGASLKGASLKGAYLEGANLYGANLYGANLEGAYLKGASLKGAYLYGANLEGANLKAAYLKGAYLKGANLKGANLYGANLEGANLEGANLEGANNLPPLAAAQTVIAPEGDLIVWKKCQAGILVKLLIPRDAKRSNATGRKCRADFADVLEIIGADVGISQHDADVVYRVGQRVTCHKWGENRWEECAGGIHFFLTREEAEAY